MKLWLIRHAQVFVQPGVCYGVSEVAADAQATALATQNFSSHPSHGSLLWTSPAQRALQLATHIKSQRPDIQWPSVDSRLHEMDFGCWEMQAWDAIPRQAIDAWSADFANHRFGGKESAQEVVNRVSAALDSALELGVPELIWVTHAGVIKSVEFLIANARCAEISHAHQWPSVSLPFGQWKVVDLEGS
jgi:alpha-ribazole phosphatase